MAMTIKQLRVASDDDLIEAHDEVASYHRLGWLPDEDRGAGATGRDRCSAASMSSAFGPVARRLAGQRATGNSGGRPCPLTTTVYWRGCGWTLWAAKHRWTFRLFRSGPPAAAARRHPAGRGLRARRHHRQPARPLARRGVPPLLIHAP